MCGFSIYLHTDDATVDKDSVLPRLDLDGSLRAIRHRGPDDTSTFVSSCGRCGLGHARLSIIDPEGGKQPISNVSGSLQCVVNGELYDYERIRDELKAQKHELSSLCDSEIALHLYEEYGLSFVDHLRGEFAIGIWDETRQRIVLVRDRFGIKPVYYTMMNGTLLAASEVKAFLAMGWKPEWDIESIVSNGALLDNRTCFKGVYKLPVGHRLVVDTSGSMELSPYWDAEYPDKTIPETRTVEEMVDGVKQRIIEAVRLRMKADVRCGIYLSGGIDSSCIAGIAAELHHKDYPESKLETFSIAFKDAGMLDESSIARRTAEFCNVNYNECVITEADLLGAFEDCVWHSEQPQWNLNSVAKFILSKFARDKGFKMVLTGEGADEHFAGYTFLHMDFLREYDESIPELSSIIKDQESRDDILFRMNEKSSANYMGSADRAKGKVSLIVNEKSPSRVMLHGLGVQCILGDFLSLPSKVYIKAILDQQEEIDPEVTIAKSVSKDSLGKMREKWHSLHSALYVEYRSLMSNVLLNGMGDRSEMAHSIEARAPFLDHHLCEYVNNLPPSVKVRPVKNDNGDIVLNEKWILKEAMKDYITPEIYKRSKHTFVAPSPAKSDNARAFIEKMITKERVCNLGWADWQNIRTFRDDFIQTGDPAIFKTLILFMSYIVIAERFDVPTYKAAASQPTTPRTCAPHKWMETVQKVREVDR